MIESISTEARATEETGDLSWFRASTNDLDRQGTIIEPKGIDTKNFKNNPVFMWGHDAYGSAGGPPELENVLGKVVDFRSSSESFDVAVEWAEHDRAVMARDLVKAGFLSAVSVGFIPDANAITSRSIGTREVPVYERTELIEVSLVPVPANPHAIALMRSFRLPVFSEHSPSDDADSECLRTETKDALTLERFRRELRSILEGGS
jgi:HK97 family phage prohead protease